MDEDDLRPLKAKPQPKNLDPMSVAELNAYIAELEGEIARARAEIAKKDRIRSGAEALFKR